MWDFTLGTKINATTFRIFRRTVSSITANGVRVYLTDVFDKIIILDVLTAASKRLVH